MTNGGSERSSDPLAEAERSLRMAGRELKWLQVEHEHTLETLQRVRRQRARLRHQLDAMSDALAASLSELYWATRPTPSGAARLLGRSSPDPEADQVREVEASDLFAAGWYLRRHPDVVKTGLAPAVHYVRHGNEARLDPGPRFSTSAYLQRHPEAARDGLPALLHAVRHGHQAEASDGGTASSSPADGIHL